MKDLDEDNTLFFVQRRRGVADSLRQVQLELRQISRTLAQRD